MRLRLLSNDGRCHVRWPGLLSFCAAVASCTVHAIPVDGLDAGTQRADGSVETGRDASDARAFDAPDGAALRDAGDVPLRLVAPLSTSRVTGQRPLARWDGAADAANIEISVGTEHTLTTSPVLQTCAAAPGACALDSVREPGTYFWRARTIAPDGARGAWTPTWEIVSVANGAPRTTSVGLVLDLDGDARADLAYGDTAPAFIPQLHLRCGADLDVETFVDADATTSGGEGGGAHDAWAAGDIDGDGLGDIVMGARFQWVGSERHSYWEAYFGRADCGLVGPTRIERALVGQASVLTFPFGAGDIDRDGYGDVVAGQYEDLADASGRIGGCVFVYRGGPAGIGDVSQTLCFRDTVENASRFGENVISGGDVDGDGFADVVVDSGFGNLHLREYLGGPAGLGAPHDIVITGYTADEQASALCGDLNADGYADIVVPASSGDTPTDDHVLFVFLGGSSGIADAPDLTARIDRSGGGTLGYVSPLGDVDGDGFDDLGVGSGNAPAVTGGPAIGTVTILRGNAHGIGASPFAVLVGPDGAHGHFGTHLSGPGDVNGDGRADLFVSADDAWAGDAVTEPDRGGRAYLYTGPLLDGAAPSRTWAGAANDHIGSWITRGR